MLGGPKVFISMGVARCQLGLRAFVGYHGHAGSCSSDSSSRTTMVPMPSVVKISSSRLCATRPSMMVARPLPSRRHGAGAELFRLYTGNHALACR